MTERVLSLRSASPALSSSDRIQQVSPGDMEAVIAAAAEAEGVGEFTPELLALARRESGFNPTAKNKNKGSSAGGLFQFTDDTARRYGLENKFDPVQNARAAARLLRDNLNALDGNIDLALAAHHVGPGKARRALTDASVGDVDVSTMQWLADVKRFSNEYRTTPQQQALATDALGLPMPNGVAVPGRSSEALPIPPRGPSNYDPEAFDVATSRGGLREVARGWKSAGLSSDANKLLYEAAQAHAGGDPVTAANLEAQAKEIMQRAGAWAPSVTSPRNIDGVGSGVDWALGNLGNLRSSIPSVVGGAVGAVAGAPFALSGPGAMIGAGLAGQREMRNEQAGSLMREAEAANVGPVQEGNAAVLQPQQYEDIVSASDLSGWLQAPLEAIVPAGVGSALVGVPKRVLQQSFEVAGKQLGRQLTQREMVEVARRTIAKEIADNGALAYVGKETAQGVVQDGATGGAQNLVQQTITNNMAGREGIDREELLDNIIAEAALGGPLSGVGTASEVVQALRQRAADDPRTLSQKAGDAIADAGGVLGRRQGKKDAAPANAALDAIEQEARARGVPPREVIAERIQRLNTPVDLSDAFTEAEATQRVMQDDEAKRATADELVRDILNDPDAPPEWRRIAEEHVAGVQAGATNKYEETGLKLGEAERKRAGVMGIVDTIAKAIEPVAGKPAPAKRGSAMTPNAPRYSDEELYRHAKLYETVPDLRTLSLNELSQLDRTIDRFAKGEFGPEVRKTLDGLFGSPEVTETVLDFYKPGASTVNTQQYDPDGGRTGADRTVMQEDESFSEATERDEENPLPTETKVEWGAGSFKLGENSYFDTKDAAQKERLEKTRGALGRDKPGATPKTAVVGMVDAEIERRGVEDAEAQRAVKLEITNQFFPQMSFMPERPANYDKMDRFARTDYDRRFQAFEKELNKRVRATNLRFQTVKATSETSKGGGLDYNDDDIKSLSLNMGKLGLNNPKTAHTRGVLIFERSDAQTPMITSAPMLLRRAFQIGADREQTGDEVGKMQNLSDLLDMSIASVLDYSARKTAAQQDYAERGIRGEVAVDEMMPEAPKMQFTGRIGYVKYGKPVYVDNLRDLPDDFKIMEQGGRTYTMGDLKAALGRKNADVAREATKTRNKLERMMKSGALNDFPKDVRARIAQAISAHKKNPSNAVAAGALNALYNKHINVDIYNAPSDFERDDIVPSESDTFTDENDQPLERGLLQYGPVGENIPIQRDADGFTSSNPAYNMTGRPDEAGVKQVGELLAKGLPAFRQTWRVASETERSQFGRALRTLAGMKPEQVIREVGSVRIERSKEKDVFVYEKPRAMTQQEGERVVKLANDVLKTYEFPTSVPEGRGRQIKEDKRVVDAGVVTEDVAVPRMRMLRDSKDLHVGMLPVVDDFGNIAMETETRFVGRMTRPARPGEMNRQADTVPSRGEDNMAPASVGRGQAAELEVPMNVEAAKRIPAEFQARPLNTQQLAIVTDALVGMNDLREQLGEFTHIGIGGALGQTRDDWNGARHLGQFIEVPDGARSDKFLLLAPSLFTAKNRHKVGFVIAHEMGHAVEGQIDLDKFAPGSEIDQLARAIPEDSDLGAKLKYPLTIKDKSDEWMAQELHAQLFAAYKHRRAAKEMIRTAPQLYKLIGEYYGEGKSKRGDNGSSGGRLGQSNSERAEARSPRGQVGSVQAGTGGPQVDDGQNARGGEPARAVAADVRADEGVAQGIAAQGNPLEEQLKAYLPLAEAKNKMLAGAIKTALKEIAAGRSLKSHEGALAAAKKQLGELDSGDTGAVAQKAAATDLKQRLAVARKVEFGELDDNASAFLKDYLSTAKWVDDTTDLREEKYALREKKNRTEAEERRLDEVEDMLQLSLVRSSPNENYADVYRDYVEELQDIGNEYPARSAQIMKILDGLDELARRAVTGNPSSTKQLTKRSEQNAQTPGEATTDTTSDGEAAYSKSPDGRIKAVTFKEKGVVVLNNGVKLTKRQQEALILHEIGVHYGLERMLGKEGFEAILAQLRSLKGVSKNVDKAYESVPKDTKEHLVDEEALAYLVENYHNMPLVKRVFALIKAWFTRTFKGASIFEDDVHALAAGAVAEFGSKVRIIGVENIQSTPKDGFVKVDFDQALKASPKMHGLLDRVADAFGDKVSLTGSLAISPQFDIYRASDEQIHDLDFRFHGTNEELISILREKLPEADLLRAFSSRRDKNLVVTIAVPNNGVEIVGVQPTGSKGKEVVIGKINGGNVQVLPLSAVNAIDFFVTNQQSSEGAKRTYLGKDGVSRVLQLVDAKETFDAKFNMGREKDMQDALLAGAGEPMLSKEPPRKLSLQTPGEAKTDAKRTAELKAALDEVKRLLGKDFDAQVSNELFDPVSGVAWSGEFDPQQMRILIAAGATDTMGTGRHEALHALFKMLRDMGHPEAVKVIQNLATNKLVLDKLKILLADHKNALEQLKDPEEAAAYAFQFWMADRLKLGPQAKTFFQKVMNFLNKAQLALRDKVFGSEVAKTERERRRQDELALKLLGAFRDGAMASPEGRVSVQAVLEANKQALAARRLNTRAFGHKFHKFLKQGVHSTASVFEDSANPHVKALGKMFFRMEGDVRGEKQNFLEAAAQANDRYQVKVRNILVKLDKDTAELVSKYMNNRTELKDIHHPEAHEAVKALRDLLKELHLYQRERNTARWDAELMEWVPIGEVKDNYYPRVWSINVLTEKQGEFIEKMTKALEKYRRDFKGFPEIEEFHADTMAKAILNKLINGAGSNDIEEMTSDLGITPWQASVNKRDLNWLDDVAPGEFTEYFSDDVAEVMTSYILQATKRAEYNRAFGRGGEKIREAMFKAMVYEMGGESLVESAQHDLRDAVKDWLKKDPETRGEKPTVLGVARLILEERIRQDAYGENRAELEKLDPKALEKALDKLTTGKVEERQKEAAERLDPVTKAVMAMEGTLGREIDPTLRHVMSGVITFQNFRLLPLALFASINDVVGMVVRGGTMEDSFQAFTRGIKEVGLMWKGEYSQDELAKLAERLGTVGGGNYLDAMGQTYSSQFMYGKLRRWNDALFKWNGLEAWNRAARIQATGVAIEFIKRHVEKPNEHSKRYLEELFGEGYDTSLIMKDGDLDYSNDRVQEAVLTWVNGAVLRPNASHRPIRASDPYYMLFYHLKQFAYSFHKVILRRAWIEAKAGNYTPAAALFTGYVPVSIAADVVKETLIMGDDDPWWTKGGLTAYLEHGVARANLGGIPQMWLGDIADPVTAFKDPGRYVGSLSNVAGPAPDQLIDLISVPFLEDKTLVKEVAGGVPGGVLIRRYVD